MLRLMVVVLFFFSVILLAFSQRTLRLAWFCLASFGYFLLRLALPRLVSEMSSGPSLVSQKHLQCKMVLE